MEYAVVWVIGGYEPLEKQSNDCKLLFNTVNNGVLAIPGNPGQPLGTVYPLGAIIGIGKHKIWFE